MPQRRPDNRRPWRVRLLLLLAVALGAGEAAARTKPCPGQYCTTVRPQDELVLINSRPLGCSTSDARLANELRVTRFVPVGAADGREWADATLEDVFAAPEPGVSTILYVHGNRIPQAEAPSRGIFVYRRLVRHAKDDRPVRFLIWSWPSAQIKGPLEDYRVKAERTRPVAYQLAWLIEQMPAGMPIGMLGYSYGARVESGAAHLLAGGSLGGLRLASGGEAVRRPMEHVYLAPAFESGWLAPRRFHGRAMRQIDRLLVTVNSRDPAMRFYPLLSKAITERALGFTGPTGLPRSFACRVRKLDVEAHVGRSHDLCDYVDAPGLMARAWRRLTFADSLATPEPTTPGPSVPDPAKPSGPLAVASAER